MDSSFTVRPRPGAPSAYAPRDPVPVRETIATDLARAVSAGGDSRQGGQDKHSEDKNQDKGGDSQPDHGSHEPVVVDPESRAVIYRERDVRAAGHEHPDDALMRRRAYGQAPSPAADPANSEPHADIEA